MRVAHNGAELVGKIFGRLRVESRGTNSKAGHRRWLCVCACGRTVLVDTAHLNSGHTQSCGCIPREKATRHGMNGSPEYRIWQQMKERCCNPNKSAYPRYGGRGITVCSRWKESFRNFFEDMGPRPTLDHTLDRIDNALGYAPENCRWATWEEQYRNRSQTVWIEYAGVRMCRKDWCRKFGVDEVTLTQRLERGWDIHTALHAPPYYQYARKGPLRQIA